MTEVSEENGMQLKPTLCNEQWVSRELLCVGKAKRTQNFKRAFHGERKTILIQDPVLICILGLYSESYMKKITE